MAALPSYIPLPEAARRLGLPETRLKTLIDVGKIKAIEINGEIAVSEESVEKREPASSAIRKEDMPEYKKFAKLAGNEISINEAARKYQLLSGTITRWMKAGYIIVLSRTEHRTLLNEQDVAYCADIYHNHNTKRGRWLFNKDGTPYQSR